MREVKVYLNVASALPGSATPIFGCAFVEIARRIGGLDGLLVLPLRTWRPWMVRIIPPSAMYYMQGAWNHGTLMQALTRLRTGDQSLPMPHDAMLFGTIGCIAQTSAMLWTYAPGMELVVVDPSNHYVVETNPDRARFENLSAGSRVALDMEHLFRPGRNGEAPLCDLRTAKSEIYRLRVRTQIESVHLKFNLPHPKPLLLASMILKAAQPERVVIEVSPGHLLGGPVVMGLKLRKLRNWIFDQL